MFKVATALKTFFSGFGLPAYAESSVPENVQLPYITYSQTQPEWNQKASMYARVWDKTKSNEGIIRKADQIAAAIGQEKRIRLDGSGYLVIWPENDLIQIQTDGDYRYAYISLSINAYHMPGV